ncbi:MAG: histidine kinase dimerization/phospho-acceptor domain-containing protein, partial [Trebonia sp.]
MTRGSVRLRLTVLFASLFLVSGAGLLGITYGLLSHANNGIIAVRVNSGAPADGSASLGTAPDGTGSEGSGSNASGGADLIGPGALAGLGELPSPQQVQTEAKAYVSETRAREDDALLLYFGIALGIMVVVAAALGWFVAGRALRPLRRITESARRISATNLHERLAIDGPDDDLRELADMIDGLFARLDASSQAQRQFVANASHELRTPLARSQTLLEVALRNPGASTGSLRAACERSLAAGAEQERLIEALLTLARGQRGLTRREPADLAAITRDVLAGRAEQVAARGLTMEVTLKPG